MKHSFFIVPALLLAACTGKKVIRTDGMMPDAAVPTELASNYEVQEYKGPSQVAPAAAPVAAVKEDPKSKKKKGAKAVTENKTTDQKGWVIPYRRPAFDPIWVGEKITMDVTWLKTRAGEFQLDVLPFKVMNNRKIYHIKGSVRTADFFKMIYRAEDSVESFIDFDGWFPYKFILKGDESRVKRDYLELFDHPKGKQYVHTVNHKLKTGEVSEDKGYKDMTPLAQDAISALYYVRTQNLVPGAIIKFPMTTNGTMCDTELHILEREELNTKMGKIKTVKGKIQTFFNGVLRQQGDSFMWFTDDPRKFPVKFEAKVKIGWVTGIATKIEPGTPPDPNANNPTPESQRTITAGEKAWFNTLLEANADASETQSKKE